MNRATDRTRRPFVLEEAVAILARTPATLDALLRGLPDGWIAAHEGGDTWSLRIRPLASLFAKPSASASNCDLNARRSSPFHPAPSSVTVLGRPGYRTRSWFAIAPPIE
ncbi:MAG: hypothetical protein HYZ58_09475 [Acidobacteria bacterium]|nr:hypothetical protein [Acidobacteriota bacterium]MBI3263366.1 hypothetical protein [Acidobacteriota bacterium]